MFEIAKKTRYEPKAPYKYLPDNLQMFNLINACLMTVVEKEGAKASIEDNILKVELSCGVVIKVENYIGNKEVQKYNDFGRCYKNLKKWCPHSMGMVLFFAVQYFAWARWLYPRLVS